MASRRPKLPTQKTKLDRWITTNRPIAERTRARARRRDAEVQKIIAERIEKRRERNEERFMNIQADLRDRMRDLRAGLGDGEIATLSRREVLRGSTEYTVTPEEIGGTEEVTDMIAYLTVSNDVLNALRMELNKHKAIRVFASMKVNYVKQQRMGKTGKYAQVTLSKEFTTNDSRIIRTNADILRLMTKFRNDFMSTYEAQLVESGWVAVRVDNMTIRTTAIRTERGRSFIPTPPWLLKKRAVINVKNTDNLCFVYSVLASLYPPSSNRNNPYTYTHIIKKHKRISWPDFAPRPIEDEYYLDEWEKSNEINLIILKIDDEAQKVYIARKSALLKIDKPIAYIIHIEDGEKGHYMGLPLENRSRLFNLGKTDNRSQKFFCPWCLQTFTNHAKRAQHLQNCSNSGEYEQDIRVPGGYLSWLTSRKEHRKLHRNPITLFYDFESTNIPESCTSRRHTLSCPPSSSTPSEKRRNTLQPHSNLVANTCCNTKRIAQQKPNSYAIVARVGTKIVETHTRISSDIRDFWNDLREIGARAQEKYNQLLVRNATCEVDDDVFYGMYNDQKSKCHICSYPLNPDADRVMHEYKFDEENNQWLRRGKPDKNGPEHTEVLHDFMTGKPLGVGHCNCIHRIKPQASPRIVVLAHNARSYDHHLILSNIPDDMAKVRMDILAKNTEKFSEIRIGNFIFRDSFSHLSASLDNLCSGLKDTMKEDIASTGMSLKDAVKKHFPAVYSEFGHYSDEILDTCLQKNVYPYEWFDDIAKFERDSLPPPWAFRSILTKTEKIDQEKYDFAQEVWDKFKFGKFRDYHTHYLKLDTLILADVWSNYVELGMKEFHIDPTHFVTLPSYAFKAMLRLTGCRLELPNTPQMYKWWESQLRGGVVGVSKRYSKRNVPGERGYDKLKDVIELLYIDANNLYGHSQMQALPVSDFTVLEHRPDTGEDWTYKYNYDEEGRHDFAGEKVEYGIVPTVKDILAYDCSDKNEIGYSLMVDIHAPQAIHNKLASYPILPTPRKTSYEELSDYQKFLHGLSCPNMTKETRIRMAESNCKLVSDLLPKEKYILDIRLAKFALQLGYKITKVHRAIRFKQFPFLYKYVKRCTEIRRTAEKRGDGAGKAFAKLMINAVYGKFIQSVRNYSDMRLLNKKDPKIDKKTTKLCAKPNMKTWHDVAGGPLMSFSLTPDTVSLDMPLYVGVTVLDRSKLHMASFFYNKLRKQLGMNGVSVLYTDTDSYVLELRNLHKTKYKNIAGLVKANKRDFDTSNLNPKNDPHKLYSEHNFLTPGPFKIETKSDILEFVALRSKVYSYICCNGSGDKKSKGTSKTVVKKDIRHEHYLDVLRSCSHYYHEQHTLASKNHVIGMYAALKKSLSGNDTKRYILADGINTLPFGHYMTL